MYRFGFVFVSWQSALVVLDESMPEANFQLISFIRSDRYFLPGSHQ